MCIGLKCTSLSLNLNDLRVLPVVNHEITAQPDTRYSNILIKSMFPKIPFPRCSLIHETNTETPSNSSIVLLNSVDNGTVQKIEPGRGDEDGRDEFQTIQRRTAQISP